MQLDAQRKRPDGRRTALLRRRRNTSIRGRRDHRDGGGGRDVVTGQHTSNASVFAEAEQIFPGGVNSPVRTFRSVGGNPIAIARAEGAHAWDVEGKRYLDFVGAFGPLVTGHAHPAIVEAVQRAAADGTAFGALAPGEVELGRRLKEATGLERVRFVNSGTEATMSAIRVARAATGRDLVVKFEGNYHGHSDGLLAKAGSGVATLGLSASAGVPDGMAGYTAVLPYNEPGALEEWFNARGSETAAVIVEAVPGNMGVVEPDPVFVEKLQSLCKAHGALLISDEVITGFRLRYGLSGIYPQADLYAMGKVIGGGLPVGAFGGRAELMDHLAPKGSVYQAGTLSGNPLVMAAGVAMLETLGQGDTYNRLEQVASFLENGLNAAIKRSGAPASIVRRGSMMTLFFRPEPPRNFAQTQESDTERFGRFHRAMLDRGILLAPSQFEATFVSTAHNESEIDEAVRAAHEALQEAMDRPSHQGSGS
ncbi:MAG: glutamate-1-semialdehyde 2,1-aminomutase [Dehalococcoidia bacterium]|nr:glutamate-1-semialdehyde 2,1-aminomutase [Dehalococcoidia bacterium]